MMQDKSYGREMDRNTAEGRRLIADILDIDGVVLKFPADEEYKRALNFLEDFIMYEPLEDLRLIVMNHIPKILKREGFKFEYLD